MKIIKFKKTSSNKYKIYFDDNTNISLYDEIIIKYNLLANKELSIEKLEMLIKENNEYDIYNLVLKFISIKMRSIYEVEKFVSKKGIEKKEDLINKLIKNNLLNDDLYTKSYINDQINLTNNGPLKIKEFLLKNKIDNEFIKKYIEKIDNRIFINKLNNLIPKYIKTKKGSKEEIKLKTLNYFHNLGYENNMILEILSKQNYEINLLELQKLYIKLYNKYKNKYKGNELKYFICNKLYSKGYTKEDILKIKEEV